MSEQIAPTISNTAMYILASALDSIPNEELVRKMSLLTSCQELWKRLIANCSEFVEARREFLAEKVGIEARIRASLPGDEKEEVVVDMVNKELVDSVRNINEIGNKIQSFEAVGTDIEFMNLYWEMLVPKLKLLGRQDLISIMQTFKITDR